VLILTYALATLALTLAEIRDHPVRIPLKLALSATFVAVAAILLINPLALGLPTDGWAYSTGSSPLPAALILAALTACALGDALLLKPGPFPGTSARPFLSGMAAFALGHALFALAFHRLAILGPDILPASALILASAGAACLLARHSPLRLPATLYGAIIGTMIVASLLTANPTLIAAALAFAASDIVVALNRFGPAQGRGSWHFALITPLYFTAQLAFALSIAGM